MNKRLTLVLACIGVIASLTVYAAPFSLTSPDFTSGKRLPPAAGGSASQGATCYGQNISPRLVWQNPSAKTQSFALIIHNDQGNNGLGASLLVAYGISNQIDHIERAALSNGHGFVAGVNSYGTQTYRGPCPEIDSAAQYYTFTLIATDLAANALPAGLSRDELLAHLTGHALAATGIVASYDAQRN